MVSLPSGWTNVLNTGKAILGNVAETFGIKNSWSSSFTANTGSASVNKLVETVAENPFITAGVAAGGVMAAKNIGTVASALVPASTGGKIAAAAAVPIVAGAVAKQPVEAAAALINTPSSLMNFGGNVADFAASPSVEKAKKIVKEDPAIAGAAALTAALAAGMGVAGLVASGLNTYATKENTKVVQTWGSQSLAETEKQFRAAGMGKEFEAAHPELFPVTTPQNQNAAVPVSQPLSGTAASSTPITPSTVEVKEARPLSSTTRRKRTTRQIHKQNISQRVNILMNTGRFINSRRFRH